MMEFGANSYPFDPEPNMMDESEASFVAPPDPPPPSTSLMYLLKDLPPPAQMTGSTNLLAHFGLESTYNKFCGKKVKESLSSFLPDLPGVSNTPGREDGSSLRGVIEKPPIVGSKEIQPLSSGMLMAFRLHPGPIPEQYRPIQQQTGGRRRNKHHKKIRPDTSMHNPLAPEMEEFEIKKHKKRKHEDGEKKKRKKEKRKKKEREKERS
ncbi:mediator of RNA polymerase II transcription subunit 19-like [Clavelina lepadiformis]|uniref:mediator of RNA polymerase II transcription subunit 19-like n=1 Tax=Clavelina lepadiformis TaxID=159417 RepID=UPI00404392D3